MVPKRKIPQQYLPIEFTRAVPAELAKFDPTTKRCTMNCSPHSTDPRSREERLFLCDDCELVNPVSTPVANRCPSSTSTGIDAKLAYEVKQAKEGLERIAQTFHRSWEAGTAIVALSALNQLLAAHQDPVAWAALTETGNCRIWFGMEAKAREWAEKEGCTLTPLYR